MSNLEISRNEYHAPSTKLESVICRAFASILKIDLVGTDDDFVSLGGNSENATDIAKECARYGVEDEDILEGRTPKEIAKKVTARNDSFFEGLDANLEKVLLTESQMGIYLECMLEPESKMYNIPSHFTFELSHEMTGEEICAGVNKVIKTHPALYCQIEEDSGQIYMVRRDFPEKGMCLYFEENLTDEEIDSIAQSFSEVIDLKNGPLFRCCIYKISNKIHIIFETHHVVCDGTSINILFRQISDLFNGSSVENETVDSFALYDVEKRTLEGPAYTEASKYFENLLGDIETDSSLIPDYMKEEKGNRNSTRYFKHFDAEVADKRLKLSNVTRNTLFMGAFGYTLAKMTGQQDSLFVVAESGRKSSAVDNTVSMLVKTIPAYMNIDENKTGLEILRELQTQFSLSVKNDCIPFSEINSKYGINADFAFVYHADLFSSIKKDNVLCSIDMLDPGDTFSKFNVAVFKEKDGYTLRIEYRNDLYKIETVERFAKLYINTVNFLLSDIPMKEMQLVSDEDDALINKFNDSYLEYDPSKTFVDIFRETVKKHPDKTAVVYKDKKYTYAEVDNISDKIACYLHKKGIGTGDFVPVLIPRCEYMVIASIGVIKSGAAYEPMDPAYPCERLTFMYEDAGAKMLIADRSMINLLPGYSGDVLFTDEIPNLPEADTEKAITFAPKGEDTYVLLYTSGTTGKPKGCMLSHSNLAAFIPANTDALKLDENSRLTLYPSYGFDAHMADLYPAMAIGCELYVIPDEMRLDFPRLKEYMEENKITHALMTTQVARQFILEYENVKYLKVVSMGGESLLSYEPKNTYKVINFYGPTESTICVTGFQVDSYRNPIPIGHPLANNRLFVVDSYGRTVPVGVPGELIVCGPQVGKGYLNRPEKTSEVFVQNTFEKEPDDRHLNCYKTGDIVRWIDDGNIIFIGRRDQQVKIRGYRIELSEVESVIRSYTGIKDAAVIAVEDNGGKSIHAYVVSDTPVDISALNSFIKSQKPAYMVPAATMQIDRIPLTVNQKLDKRKLPPITATNNPSKRENSGKRALTVIEEQLMEILKEIVGECDVDVQTEFEYAGITSISSIQLASRIYKKFGLHITSKELLGGGSILSVENAIINQLLSSEGKKEDKSESKLLSSYPLTQTQMGIYLDSMRTGMGAYNMPTFYKLPDGISIDRLKDAVRKAISNHPSMLVYIHPDEKGDIALYPALDMDYEIEEIKLSEPCPKLTEFSFDKNPLFHVSIISCQEEKYLFIELHHIIGDGESMAVLMDDIDRAYRGQTLEKEELTAFEVSLNEQKDRKGEELNKAKAVYDSIFRGISNDYTPCCDRQAEESSYATYKHKISANSFEIQKFCTENGITPNVLFTSNFALTVARYTFHEDALFSTIYNGRIDPRTQRLVSMLVKTLPVYVQADPKTTVQDFLKSVDKRLNQLRQNDIFSFADAAREYGVSADVMFIYQGKVMSETKLDGKNLESVPVNFESTKANLSVEVFDKNESFGLMIEYNSGCYSEDWTEEFAGAFDCCLSSLIKAETLADVSITSDEAFHRFDNFNDTDIDVTYRPVYKRLTEQSELHPNKIAVVSSAEDEKLFKDSNGKRIYEKLTYSQLENMTNALAQELIASGIKPGEAVGVMTGRSKEVYIGQFGILKAGCPFIFLSPSYPLERIAYICKEASVKAVVTTHAVAKSHSEMYEKLNITPVFADDICPDVKAENPNIDVKPDDLAYMIYTSGSTGQPKGVMITQKGLNNLADNNEKNYQVKYILADVMCAVTAFTFDASIVDGYVSIANGATLCIASEEDIHNPFEFCTLCLDNGIESFICTPSFAVSLLDCPDYEKVVRQLKSICCGGEVFPPRLYDEMKSMNPYIRLVNGYGPSETTVDCSIRLLESSQHIDIGTPISNTKIYIIDRQNHILPMGALGELVITGIGVGLGYLNREDLTKKSFFKLNGASAYKSGDLAVINHNECIEFHGRLDNQVKLRGLRVELGEIESVINAFPGVKNSIVIVKGAENNQYLCAYFTADRAISYEDIKKDISEKLAEYMVPRIFIQLDEMPMTANGKIDKKSLPEPVAKTEEREYVAPSNPTEEALCKVFAEALGLDKVGVTEDFFALGGTSLTATKVAMFALANDIHIVYKDVFANPTVRQLSTLALDSSSDETSGNSAEDDYSDINRVLENNVWNDEGEVGCRPLGNVLITGVTGFLGIHILRNILEREKGEVYCLIKKGHLNSAEERLNDVFFYYFEKTTQELGGDRVHCIEGDITDRDFILGLGNLPIDTVFNCAACIKHFVNSDILQRVNVDGVKNLADYCIENKCRLIHISTISVAGESINGIPDMHAKITENMLYFNQYLENEYVISKFNSEKIVLNAVSDGLDGKIMRLGNLMPRYSDGEFQMNFLTNGFMRRLRGYCALGCVPYPALLAEMDYSSIDDTADAIVALSKTDKKYSVYHVNNIHHIFLSDVICAMNKAGICVENVSDSDFTVRLKTAMSNPDCGDEVAGLIAYMNRKTEDKRFMIGCDNTFTAKILNRIGYNWSIPDVEYLVNVFKKLKELGFFS